MKECKNSGILPCSEETVQGIIEALRKLREASELEEASNRLAEHIFEDILKSIKSNDMEKKTKKMTKAEAFEWLDGKKIRTLGKHEKVLRKLFDLGFVWKNLRNTRVDLDWQPGEVYGLTISNDEVTWWATPHLFDTHDGEQVGVHDILSIEIVEDEPLDKWDYFARCVAKVQEKIEEDEVCIITKGNFLTMTK